MIDGVIEATQALEDTANDSELAGEAVSKARTAQDAVASSTRWDLLHGHDLGSIWVSKLTACGSAHVSLKSVFVDDKVSLNCFQQAQP